MSLANVIFSLYNGGITAPPDGGGGSPGLTAPVRIKFFGDSIVRGESSTDFSTKSYAALTAIHFGAAILNYGYSGSVVDPSNGFNAGAPGHDLVNNYPFANDGLFAAGNYVYLAYGTNDYAGGFGTLDPAPWIASYLSFINAIVAFGYQPNQIIVGTAPYQSTRNSPPFVSALQAMSIANGFNFYDAYSYTQTRGGAGLIVDGIHPADAGHAVIAEGLIAYIESLLV